jgi:hypothetical protein
METFGISLESSLIKSLPVKESELSEWAVLSSFAVSIMRQRIHSASKWIETNNPTPARFEAIFKFVSTVSLVCAGQYPSNAHATLNATHYRTNDSLVERVCLLLLGGLIYISLRNVYSISIVESWSFQHVQSVLASFLASLLQRPRPPRRRQAQPHDALRQDEVEVEYV